MVGKNNHLLHIDGLRAIAVAWVILFHLSEEYFSGGYLGVDIFFVISGFVISGSLFRNFTETGSIDIKKFYVRRFKRLYPALFVMLSVSTMAYVFFGFLWDTNLLLKSSISAFFASSNLYFLFRGDGYFDIDSINPLLHTWSLGVEEQFYVVYPLLLLILLVYFSRQNKTLTHLKLILGSFVVLGYALFAFSDTFIFTEFYSPLARSWELGIGCLLFFLLKDLTVCRYQDVSLWTGLATLAGVFAAGDTLTLTVAASITTIATALVIYGGLRNNDSRLYVLLTKPSMLYVGALSYSLYLWHLPVIYFAFLYVGSTLYFIIVLLVTTILAVLSYHFVETPLRYATWLAPATSQSLLRITMGAGAGVLLIVLINQAHIRGAINETFDSFSESIRSVNYIESSLGLGERMQPRYLSYFERSQDCSTRYANLTATCLSTAPVDTDATFYLIGDSHAVHFVPMLIEAESVPSLFLHDTNFKFGIIAAVAKENYKATLANQRQDIEFLTSTQTETDVYYVISAYLSEYYEHFDQITQNLRDHIEMAREYGSVILVAQTPIFKSGPEACVLLGKYCTTDDEDQVVINASNELFQRLANEYTNVYFYNPNSTICASGQCVKYRQTDDELVYRDDDHISVEESRRLAPNFDAWFKENVQ